MSEDLKATQPPLLERQLPSGLTVKLRRPGILTWHAVMGSMPIIEPGGPPPAPATAAVTIAQTLDLICACAIEPRFSRDRQPTDGAMSLEDLTMPDAWALMKYMSELASDTLKVDTEAAGPLSPTGARC